MTRNASRRSSGRVYCTSAVAVFYPDPSRRREHHDGDGRSADGRDGPAAPRGSADAAGWPRAAGGDVGDSDTASCSSSGPGNTVGRPRKPRRRSPNGTAVESVGFLTAPTSRPARGTGQRRQIMAAWTCLFAGYDLSVVGLSNPDRVTDRGLSFPPAENDYPNRSDRRADAATMMSGMMRLSRREVQKTTLSDDRSHGESRP